MQYTAGPPTMLASDQDRDLAISDLREACASGRLTSDQYTMRMQSALGASTLQELWFLTSDIPRLSAGPETNVVPAASAAPCVPYSPYSPYSPYPGYSPYPAYSPHPPALGPRGYYPPVPWTLAPGAIRPKDNPLAVIAFILSILGLITWFSFVVGVVAGGLGIIALRQIQRSKTEQGGRGLGIAAVAISASTILIGLIYWVAYLVR
jgi:hypothetical protein